MVESKLLTFMKIKKRNQKVDENFLSDIASNIKRLSQPQMVTQKLPIPSGSAWNRKSSIPPPSAGYNRHRRRDPERIPTPYSAFEDEPAYKQMTGPSELVIERPNIMQAVFPKLSKSDPKAFFTSLYKKNEKALSTFTKELTTYLTNPGYLDQNDLTKVLNLIEDVYKKTNYEPLKKIPSEFIKIIKNMKQVNENLKLIIKALILESMPV